MEQLPHCACNVLWKLASKWKEQWKIGTASYLKPIGSNLYKTQISNSPTLSSTNHPLFSDRPTSFLQPTSTHPRPSQQSHVQGVQWHTYYPESLIPKDIWNKSQHIPYVARVYCIWHVNVYWKSNKLYIRLYRLMQLETKMGLFTLIPVVYW